MRTVAALLAYQADDVKPGWVALVLVLALVVATYLLWRSMNKQLRKINVPTRQEIRDAEAVETEGGDADGSPGGEKPGGS